MERRKSITTQNPLSRENMYAGLSQLVAKVVDMPLSVPLQDEKRDYLVLRREEKSLYRTSRTFVSRIRSVALGTTGIVNFISRFVPLDKFDHEMMRYDSNKEINEEIKKMRKQIAKPASRRRPGVWTSKEEARHLRWIAASTVLFLANDVAQKDPEGVKDEVQTCIRRLLLDGVADSRDIEGALIDEGWVLKTVLPLAENLHPDDEGLVQKLANLTQYVNAPLLYIPHATS